MNSSYAETLFNFLYKETNGYAVSAKARIDHGESTEHLLYGEITFESWQEIVRIANPKKDAVFFDLGSGTGKPAMLSHLAFDFKKIVGVELLKGLRDKSLQIKNSFDEIIKPQILEYGGLVAVFEPALRCIRNEIAEHVKGRELSFVQSDLFNVDLAEADFVFLNYPFKTKKLFDELQIKLLTELKAGSKIAIVIKSFNDKSFNDKSFKPIGDETLKFSWGEAKTYFYEIAGSAKQTTANPYLGADI